MTSPSKGSLRWRGNPASKGHPGLSEDGTCREETLNPLLCPQTHFSVGCDYLGSYFVTASQCPYKEGSLTVRNKALGGSPAGSDSKESPCNAEDCLSSQLEICFLFQEIKRDPCEGGSLSWPQSSLGTDSFCCSPSVLPNQQHLQSPGTHQECKFSGSTPDLLSQSLQEWGQASLFIFKSEKH